MTFNETDTTPIFAISLFRDDDPNSLPQRAPKMVVEALARMPVKYIQVSEAQLLQGYRPSDRDAAIRISFWAEYHRAVQKGTFMRMNAMCFKVMAEYEFRRKLKTSHTFTAYLCTEPPSLAAINEDLVRAAFKRCREITDCPPEETRVEETFDPQGNVLSRVTTTKPISAVLKLAAEFRKETVIRLKQEKPLKFADDDEEMAELDARPIAPPLDPRAEMAAINQMIKGK